MSGFEYRPFVNPYTASIGDLILREGDIAAHAAEAKGQAYAQAFKSVGDTIGAIPQQLAQAKVQGQETQLRGLQIDQATHAAQSRTTLAGVMKDTPFADEDGLKLYDIPTISNKLSAAGFGDAVPDVAPHLEALNTSLRNEQAAKLQTVKTGAASVAAAGNDPELALHFLDTLAANHSFPPDQIQQFRDFVKADPGNTAKLTAYLAGPQKDEILPEGATAISPLTHQPTAQGAPKPPTEAELALKAAGGDAKGAMQILKPPPAQSLQSENVLVDGKPAMVTFDPRTGKRTNAAGEDVSARVKPIPTAAQVTVNAGTLTDAALDQAATKYLQTGQLPPGYGAAGTIQKTKIMNRAAEMDPHAALARNQATFKADSANLSNLTKTEGTLSAFESTAGKNLDQFLALADKIPDTGVPWLNTPVRMLDEKLVGSENMAAINAARDVALREIARVTNDPKLSGALTDSARQEVAALSPKDATLPQIKAVVKVLKQDMANVHTGLNQQIETVKNSMGNNPAGTPPPADTKSTVTVTAPNGKTYTFPDQASADAFKAKAGIK